MDALVSIIVPAYNAEQYMENCIKSILSQSYSHLEIIIIDDGSKDATLSICRRFAEQDNRIVVISQQNKGVSAARNAGLERATGRYIVCVDADDLLPNVAVERLAREIQGYEYVIGSYESFSRKSHKKVQYEERELEFSSITEYFTEFNEFIGPPWGRIFDAEIIRTNNLRYDETVAYMEDHLFSLNYCKSISKIKVLSDTVYLRREGGMATTVRYHSNVDEINLKVIRAYQSLLQEMENTEGCMDWLISKQYELCVWYYMVNCAKAAAIEKIRGMQAQYVDYMRNCIPKFDLLEQSVAIMEIDAETLYKKVFQKKAARLLVKKLINYVNRRLRK